MSFLQGFTHYDQELSARPSSFQGNNNLTEFDKLEQEYNNMKFSNKRFYTGTEFIRIFKDQIGQSGYLCEICQLQLNTKDVFHHLASYCHIFRYTKISYPNEYRTITNNIDSIRNKMRAILSLNEFNRKKVIGINQKPREFDCQNIDRELNNYLVSFRERVEPIHIEDENELIQIEWNEEDNYYKNMRNESQNLNQPSSFLSGFMANEDEEFTSAPSQTSMFANSQDSRYRTILDELKNETDHSSPCTSKQAVKEEPTEAASVDRGYQTDELDNYEEQEFYEKINEKIQHCLDTKKTFSPDFIKILVREFENLNLSEAHRLIVYEILATYSDSESEED